MPEDDNPHLHHLENLKTHSHMHAHAHTHTNTHTLCSCTKKQYYARLSCNISYIELSMCSVKLYTMKACDGMAVLPVAVND